MSSRLPNTQNVKKLLERFYMNYYFSRELVGIIHTYGDAYNSLLRTETKRTLIYNIYRHKSTLSDKKMALLEVMLALGMFHVFILL